MKEFKVQAITQAAAKEELKYLHKMLKQDNNIDELSVDNFCQKMKEKMKQSRLNGRSGWYNPKECTVEYLSKLLIEHVYKGDPVDVANFCMMLYTRGSLIINRKVNLE